jgi:ATP-dependent DNA helicase RecQ
MEPIEKVLRKYWGFDSLLPLQDQAMKCAVEGRDSIVVLPTGGGKSLCFQAPAVTLPGLTVVVSPLISLMKDQVDSLTECGVSAARLDSSQHRAEQEQIHAIIRAGDLKILYLAPERLVTEGFMRFLQEVNVSLIAVDEAHCVSMWGHDFRPEYRQLGILKETFPKIGIHAYTATATRHVREDIGLQLNLDAPKVIVGSFDRPNLHYKIQRRNSRYEQVCEVVDRHKGESGIVYCIRRKEVEEMYRELTRRGYSASPYHAGMESALRKQNHEAFISEEIDTIVATVAFGMGIDKSNVRYVVHAGMPKSLEHYQQESGRAGRDGLEAECCLFYSGRDYVTWEFLLGDMEPKPRQIAMRKLSDMYNHCTGVTCRHRALVEYFGQELPSDNCAACDVCLGDLDGLEDSLPTAQKILSCILRLGQRFGADYTTLVLIGSREQRILKLGHEKLSTYGILSDQTKKIVRDWLEQLVGQGCIKRTGEFRVLNVTPRGWRVLKGEETPHLLKPVKTAAALPKLSKAAKDSWEGVDKELFASLRQLRRTIAVGKNVPAFVVFSDATLREMARRQPATLENFMEVSGVGEKKCEQYGAEFLEAIRQYNERPREVPEPQ